MKINELVQVVFYVSSIEKSLIFYDVFGFRGDLRIVHLHSLECY